MLVSIFALNPNQSFDALDVIAAHVCGVQGLTHNDDGVTPLRWLNIWLTDGMFRSSEIGDDPHERLKLINSLRPTSNPVLELTDDEASIRYGRDRSSLSLNHGDRVPPAQRMRKVHE